MRRAVKELSDLTLCIAGDVLRPAVLRNISREENSVVPPIESGVTVPASRKVVQLGPNWPQKLEKK